MLGILYCVSQYPAPAESFNLATIDRFKKAFPNATIGFSDHSIGCDAALAAVKLGARIIEKHFSFSRDWWGADHTVSMTPSDMKALVESIRCKAYESVDATAFYGDYDKELEGANNQFRPYFNKGLAAGRDIKAGELITEEMIYAMRPKMYLNGLASNCVGVVVGRRAKVDIGRYAPLSAEFFE